MNDKDKINIRKLRMKGYGYKYIAKEMGISPNTVKTYCKRHLQDITTQQQQGLCPQCGNIVKQIKGRKPRRFCCDECRMEYWREHTEELNLKATYDFYCKHCGKPFTAYGNSSRIYCSHECYINERFGSKDERRQRRNALYINDEYREEIVS